MITLEKYTKIYENESIGLDNVSLHINKGEFVFVVGSSGSGKSTFVRSVLREVKATSGKITVDGHNLRTLPERKLPYFRRNLGIVFQDYKLLSDKTVYENVAFAMEVVGASQKEIRRTIPKVLSLVKLEKKMYSYPSQLSGGEKQRTAIARAIVNRPPLLICDEPTGNLDPKTAFEIIHLIEHINKLGTTVVVVTHARDIVDVMQKRVINLKRGKVIRDTALGGYGNEY
ncbi:MAG: cell division ATP-binding protein FtsE [Lachnospirales bacterium]